MVSRTMIAEACLEIIAAKGYGALTMAALAKKLGIVPSALYNHVKNKADLMRLIQDEVMAQVDDAPLRAAVAGTLPAREALRVWARSYRDVFSHHTPLIEVIATFPIAGSPNTIAAYDLVARVLLLAGVPAAEVLPRLIALESFIYGSAYDVHAPADIFVAGGEEGEETGYLRQAVAAFHGGGAVVGAESNPFAERPFALGLEALLAGIGGGEASQSVD